MTFSLFAPGACGGFGRTGSFEGMRRILGLAENGPSPGPTCSRTGEAEPVRPMAAPPGRRMAVSAPPGSSPGTPSPPAPAFQEHGVQPGVAGRLEGPGPGLGEPEVPLRLA